MDSLPAKLPGKPTKSKQVQIYLSVSKDKHDDTYHNIILSLDSAISAYHLMNYDIHSLEDYDDSKMI